MAHSHHGHREHQVSHRRVDHILKDEPEGAKKHSKSHAFSKVTSKTAAEHHDSKVAGKKGPKRYARGGKVKHGHQTNIAIVVPHRPGATPMNPPMAGQPAGPPVPMGGPAPSPMGAPPPGMPPGMPMRKHGGRVKRRADGGEVKYPASDAAKGLADAYGKQPWYGSEAQDARSAAGKAFVASTKKAKGGSIDGESTIADDKKWSKRAESNSYFRGGAASGVGREEKAEHMKRKGK